MIWRISDLDDGRVSVTLERQDLFAQTFPELVSAYNDVKRQQKIPKNGSKGTIFTDSLLVRYALQQWFSTWGSRAPRGSREDLQGYLDGS